MRFRSRSSEPKTAGSPAEAVETQPASGPYDIDALPPGWVAEELLDLGSVLLAPVEGVELQIQVDEASGLPAAMLLANVDGAVELRAFAAPRGGGLWAEVVPALRDDVIANGGLLADSEGPWGPEVHATFTVTTPDGQSGNQHTRMIGIDGPRWMLRATFLGKPALEPHNAQSWHDLLNSVVVRRGGHAVPKGEVLPLTLPANAKPVHQ
ncbi:hypothetical protein Back2_02530 [Nocardioides baekrokdamisoli]|uniref:DUF3710 domain-containing protein n=1 Tax=Nocardioides baekrokdamisoli TaxID=1804624 RepID=A0A3G9ICB3_9ACTN|nr:DUF3710 domain-containing protein [Nocardioides baekrokdamisoli]BBH15966.1 hypothetical protein Back2_02530 [Nocardioides baekrokdamisoli]